MRMKLDGRDEDFLRAPQGATILFAGTSGTETWIERDRDLTVELGVRSVGIATADGGTLEVCIQVGESVAKGLDTGSGEASGTLRASQSVQVLVKAGERLAFKAFPTAKGCQLLRTTVFAVDTVKVLAKPAESAGKLDRADAGTPAHEAAAH